MIAKWLEKNWSCYFCHSWTRITTKREVKEETHLLILYKALRTVDSVQREIQQFKQSVKSPPQWLKRHLCPTLCVFLNKTGFWKHVWKYKA